MTRPFGNPKQDEDDQLVRYHLDREAMSYLYVQMAEHLAKRIADGDLAVNQLLPAEMLLAREYGVSLGTARHATRLLREWGLVATLRCKGTFVVGTASENAAVQIAGNVGAARIWDLDR